MDIFSRHSPAVVPRFSFKSGDVVTELERIRRSLGYPTTIRVDQGSELISRKLDQWAYCHSFVLDASSPGTPTDNAFIESFNGKLWAECFNAHWFMTLADASAKCEDGRRDYIEHRPHSSVGNNVPAMLQNLVTPTGPA